MGSISSSFARVPNLLISRSTLNQLSRTNLSVFRLNEQLATGLQVIRPSDDSVRAATIALLNESLARSEQRLRNLQHAESSLDLMDDALIQANDLILQAKSLAVSQIGFGSTPEERANEAIVVSSMIDELLGLSNRKSVAGYLFGGTRAESPPVESFLGGYRFRGTDRGLVTDIGLGEGVPITMGSGNAIGATSARIVGGVTLMPNLTSETRLDDLVGASGLGIRSGQIDFSFNGGTKQRVDLSGADTVGDVMDMLTYSIRQYETTSGETVLGSGGISISGRSMVFDVAGTGSPLPALEFADTATDGPALDLGLTNGATSIALTSISGVGNLLEPELNALTSIASVPGLTLGQIRINNMGQSRVVDLSGAQSFQDIKNLIETSGLGVRVEFDSATHKMVVLNEVAGGRIEAMSIEEVSGGGMTATALGIRSLDMGTRVSDFNDGRGVGIVTGNTDATTGLPDPVLNADFIITLGNGATVSVDLRPEDMVNVASVIARINSEADAQLPGQGLAAGDFTASLTANVNGIAFTQSPALGGAGGISIEKQNNSQAAEDLGLLDGVYRPVGATFVSEDRSKVRVDSLFSALIDLRDALGDNNQFGIEFASSKIDAFTSRLGETRALVGGYAKRVAQVTRFEEDRVVLDEQTRSSFRDLDFIEATSRFSLLQVQQQAGLQAAALSSRLSLLDFLG